MRAGAADDGTARYASTSACLEHWEQGKTSSANVLRSSSANSTAASASFSVLPSPLPQALGSSLVLSALPPPWGVTSKGHAAGRFSLPLESTIRMMGGSLGQRGLLRTKPAGWTNLGACL